MKTTLRNLNWQISFAATLIVTLVMAALGTAEAAPGERHPRVREVNRRFNNQQDRIAAGIKSGQLTAKETANLETKEAALKNEEHTFRLENNGHLTRDEQITLNKQ
jgi:hypothetical protein